jgi:hypothetical protein
VTAGQSAQPGTKPNPVFQASNLRDIKDKTERNADEKYGAAYRESWRADAKDTSVGRVNMRRFGLLA